MTLRHPSMTSYASCSKPPCATLTAKARTMVMTLTGLLPTPSLVVIHNDSNHTPPTLQPTPSPIQPDRCHLAWPEAGTGTMPQTASNSGRAHTRALQHQARPAWPTRPYGRQAVQDRPEVAVLLPSLVQGRRLFLRTTHRRHSSRSRSLIGSRTT